MPGRVLVDNLAAALPDHAQHGAALGRPAADDAQRIAKLTGTETRPDNRKGIANHHPVRWTQNFLPPSRKAVARAHR